MSTPTVMTESAVRVTLTALGVLALLLLPLQALPAGAMPTAAQPAPADEEDYGRMMMVLDSSGSMKEETGGGERKIDAARTALDGVIAGLPDEADVGLRVYGAKGLSRPDKGACTDSEVVVPPGTGNRDELSDAVADYEPRGETPTGYALRQAAKDLGDEGERSIVLVSDGEATCPPPPCDVARELHKQGIDLRIDVVGLSVSGKARAQLQCVAAAGGGEYHDADSAEEITEGLSRAAERAVKPFELEGTPIEGSPDADEPATIGPGLWADSLGPVDGEREVLHYVFKRTIPGSTLHTTVNSLGQPGEWDSLEVEVTDPDGSHCAIGNDHKTIDRASVLGANVTVPSDEPEPEADQADEDPCATADELMIRVARTNSGGDQEIPISLLVVEEPPVTGIAELPAPLEDSPRMKLPDTDVDGGEVTGGNAFATATELETGNYQGEIVPGETQVFKVHLDWGQQAAARVHFPAGLPALYEFTGVQGPFADVRLYSPMRALQDETVEDSKSFGFSTGSTVENLDVMTYPVRYRNRFDGAGSPALPGDYYVIVSVNEDSGGDTYLLPFTLSLEVLGEPEGKPTYADDASVQYGDVPSGDDTGTEGGADAGSEESGASSSGNGDSSGAEGASDSDGSSAVKIGAAVGLAVLAAVALALALRLLRRGRLQ